MRTDGRTDVTKLIGAFRNFSKASKNVVRVRGQNLAGSGIEQWQDLLNTVLIPGESGNEGREFSEHFWLLAILGVSFETGAGIYSGCLSQLPLGLLCCKRPQRMP